MLKFNYRQAKESDIPAMARIRSQEWETEEYWCDRISKYLNCELYPQRALKPRISFVALDKDSVIGFIAGHLTQRYECDGELEWINVVPERRGSEAASELLRLLAAWFVEQNSRRICVNVAPDNLPAQRFYRRHGAEDLNKYFLVWKDIEIVLNRDMITAE